MIKNIRDFKFDRDSTPILDSNLTVAQLALSNHISKDNNKLDYSTEEIYSILQNNIIEFSIENIDHSYLKTVTLAIFIKSGKLFSISKEEPKLRKTDDIQKWLRERKLDLLNQKVDKIKEIKNNLPASKNSALTEESMSFLKIYLLGTDKKSHSINEIKEILSDVKEEYKQEVIVDHYYIDKLCQKMYSELGCLYYIKNDCIIKASDEIDWQNHIKK